MDRWYRNAVIYSLDVGVFQDSNGDGYGDIVGLTSRLDYLSRLGVNTIWLNPIHPSPRRDGGYAFPGVESETWTYDDVAEAWFRHRFYTFEPDLNTDNPAVRTEIRKILEFWLRLGVAGFRVDAAPMLIESRAGGYARATHDYAFLGELRDTLSWRRGLDGREAQLPQTAPTAIARTEAVLATAPHRGVAADAGVPHRPDAVLRADRLSPTEALRAS